MVVVFTCSSNTFASNVYVFEYNPVHCVHPFILRVTVMNIRGMSAQVCVHGFPRILTALLGIITQKLYKQYFEKTEVIRNLRYTKPYNHI